jgi:exosortase/archaeosortase family protein
VRTIISYAVGITLLIVAGFGIYNILNMMIYEKMDSIAILKATGFSGNDVKWIFISLSLIIGITGGLFGLLFGFAGLIISYHGAIKSKLWFIPVGLLGIHTINILRIVILAIISKINNDWVDFIYNPLNRTLFTKSDNLDVSFTFQSINLGKTISINLILLSFKTENKFL